MGYGPWAEAGSLFNRLVALSEAAFAAGDYEVAYRPRGTRRRHQIGGAEEGRGSHRCRCSSQMAATR